jgi:hypothetical protein
VTVRLVTAEDLPSRVLAVTRNSGAAKIVARLLRVGLAEREAGLKPLVLGNCGRSNQHCRDGAD